MKKILFALSLFIAVGCSAQPPAIAPYKILKIDNSYTTNADLKKNKPTMLIYFAPDCSHCQKLVYDMKPKMNSFKDLQIVMVTFSDIKMVKPFYDEYKLASFPNITIGSEGYGGSVQKFYQIRTTPFIAFYNTKGNLVKSYEKVPVMAELQESAAKAVKGENAK
ncbi:hypothetical protein A0256_05375 [Mucilaginibacter sp. PAMC 26640]|nr:hypothetical protein A0256_05375 [Mucilaginibacter sp. PAMC 26640]